MKKIKIFLILMAMGVCVSTHAQTIAVSKSAAFPDNEGDSLQGVANEFANRVGEVLKEKFPMKIDSASLSVSVVCSNDTVRLTYYVALVKCDSSEAEYYFDHRGALTKDIRPYVAGVDAETRCADQAVLAMRAFKNKYGNISSQRYIDVYTKCSNGYTYALSEYFIAAKKK